MNKVSTLCALLLGIPCLLNAQAITGDIPYAKKLLNPDGSLKVWTMGMIHNDKTLTINPGGNTIEEKDIRSKSNMLGYSSLTVEKDDTANNKADTSKKFSGTLDLTNAVLPAKIAILVDDIAVLRVEEILAERKEGIEGPVFSDTFSLNGTALWNPRSYKEFSTYLPVGRKYNLHLTYSNTANLTPKYGGEIDVDGVSVYVSLPPMDLISDLNNDGVINFADSQTLRNAKMPSATLDDKAKAVEYILQDNLMSNGAWDNQDQVGNISYDWPQYGNLDRAPVTGEMDDDAIAIEVKVPSFGVAWFTHEAIGTLAFYRDKECSNAISIDLKKPFDLSNQLPERLWIKFRATVSIVDTVQGTLTLHIGKSTTEEWAALDLPFTLVPEFGCEKFFEAARNYIFERNSQVFLWDYYMPDRYTPAQIFRLCVMREEATTVKGYDAFANNKKGIEAVALAAGTNKPTVMVNGNQCFFAAGYEEGVDIDLFFTIGRIADGCHGRLIVAGATAGISSDNFDNTTRPSRGSDLAGPDPIPVGKIAGNDGIRGTGDDIANPNAGNPGGKFLALTGTAWNFAAGQATGTDAVGGLSTNYASPIRSDKAHQMIGQVPCREAGKGCVFTATQIYGVGQAPAFAAAAKKSGNQMLSPSTDVLAQELFILDSGGGSLALQHIDPVGKLRKAYIGRKSATGIPYYVNNYIQFWATEPRP